MIGLAFSARKLQQIPPHRQPVRKPRATEVDTLAPELSGAVLRAVVGQVVALVQVLVGA